MSVRTDEPERNTGPPPADGRPTYVLRLYITGQTRHSMHALENLKKICEEHLRGNYQLDVVDVYEHPELAAEAQIYAIPTLVKSLPEPLRRIIGDLSDTPKTLVGLDIRPHKGGTTPS